MEPSNESLSVHEFPHTQKQGLVPHYRFLSQSRNVMKPLLFRCTCPDCPCEEQTRDGCPCLHCAEGMHTEKPYTSGIIPVIVRVAFLCALVLWAVVAIVHGGVQ